MKIGKMLAIVVSVAVWCGVAAQASASAFGSAFAPGTTLINSVGIGQRNDAGAVTAFASFKATQDSGLQLSVLYQVGSGAGATMTGLTFGGQVISNCTVTNTAVGTTKTGFCTGIEGAVFSYQMAVN